ARSPRALDRDRYEAGDPRRLEDDMRATAAERGTHAPGEVVARLERSEAEPVRRRGPRLALLDDERHPAERPREQRAGGTDRAEAEHEHALARAERSALQAVQGDGEGLRERALLARDRVGERYEHVLGHADEPREAAVRVEPDGAAIAAEVVVADRARFAAAAAPAGVDGRA